jgi:hypothetical protein
MTGEREITGSSSVYGILTKPPHTLLFHTWLFTVDVLSCFFHLRQCLATLLTDTNILLILWRLVIITNNWNGRYRDHYKRDLYKTRDFYSLKLPLWSIVYLQRCFRRSLAMPFLTDDWMTFVVDLRLGVTFLLYLITCVWRITINEIINEGWFDEGVILRHYSGMLSKMLRKVTKDQRRSDLSWKSEQLTSQIRGSNADYVAATFSLEVITVK